MTSDPKEYASIDRINQVLQRMLELDWRRNWVIYPLPQTSEMQVLLKSQRLVIYQVIAPLDRRLSR